MHNKQTLTLTGIGMLGAAVLLAGCGGSSLSTTEPCRPSQHASIHLRPGANRLLRRGERHAGNQAFIEGSGFQAASGGQAFITGNTAFAANYTHGRNPTGDG